MAITSGFNEEAVNQIVSAGWQSQMAFEEYAAKLNTDYIGGIADSWVSQEGYDYFNETFKVKMDEIYSEADVLIADICNKVTIAGDEWAEATGVVDKSMLGYNMADWSWAGYPEKCDTSAIKAQQDNGDRGIDVAKVESLNSVLDDCFEGFIQSIQSIQKSVKGNEFLGGNQTEELQTRLKDIEKKLTSLLEDTKNDVNDYVFTVIQEYTDLGSTTSGKFSIDGKNVDFSRITNNSADSLNGKFWSEDNIHKNRWGDNKSGKLDYEIKENGSVLITEDGAAMGWTDKKGLVNAISKEKGYISLEPASVPNNPNKLTPGQVKLQDIERRDQNPMIGTGYKVNEISDQNGKIIANLQNKTTGEKATGTLEYNEKTGDVIYTQYEKRSSNSN